MERQAGLGRSLEDVLDSVPPIEPTEPAPTDVLFGLGPDDAVSTNGTKKKKSKDKKKKKSKGKKKSKNKDKKK